VEHTAPQSTARRFCIFHCAAESLQIACSLSVVSHVHLYLDSPFNRLSWTLNPRETTRHAMLEENVIREIMNKTCALSIFRSLRVLKACEVGSVTYARPFSSAAPSCSQRSSDLSDSDIAAADPFLSKLQKQTEAGYLELLARKDDVPETEEDKLAEEELERRNKERGEWGGPAGREPTRYGDWEKGGRCSDF